MNEEQIRALLKKYGNLNFVKRIGGKSLDAKLKRIPDDHMDATEGLIQLCDSFDYVPNTMEVV